LRSKKRKSIFSYYDRESAAAIEMRRIYSHISRMTKSNGSPIKSVAITSATLGEGKSTVAAMFSISIADSTGKNVLLVDSDFRRPKINELFNINLKGGLTDILRGDLPLSSCIRETIFSNFKIISAGKISPRHQVFFNKEGFAELINKAKYHFDLIVFDCPPIIPVSDVMDISAEVDGVLILVKAGKTPKEVVKRAVDLIDGSEGEILGVVLNDVERVLPYYYDYNYYNYKYKTSIPKSSRKRKIIESDTIK